MALLSVEEKETMILFGEIGFLHQNHKPNASAGKSWVYPTLDLHLARGPYRLCKLIAYGTRPWKLDHQVEPWK